MNTQCKSETITEEIGKIPLGVDFYLGDYEERRRYPVRAYIRRHASQLGWTLVNSGKSKGHFHRSADYGEVMLSSQRGAGHSLRQLHSSLGEARLCVQIAYANAHQSQIDEAEERIQYYKDCITAIEADPQAAKADY